VTELKSVQGFDSPIFTC